MAKPSDRLHALAKLYEERNAIYGQDYKRHGKVMKALLPAGINLDTEEDFGRYAILVHLISKLGRYGGNFAKGGHVDSLNDISVYAQMMQELDNDMRKKRKGRKR